MNAFRSKSGELKSHAVDDAGPTTDEEATCEGVLTVAAVLAVGRGGRVTGDGFMVDVMLLQELRTMDGTVLVCKRGEADAASEQSATVRRGSARCERSGQQLRANASVVHRLTRSLCITHPLILCCPTIDRVLRRCACGVFEMCIDSSTREDLER
jgi:hypothetical protein